MTICKLCDKPAHARGWCSRHYALWRYHGDASVQGRESWDLDVVRKGLFHGAKQRAKKKNLPFSIRAVDVCIPTHCPVLGIKLEVGNRVLQDASPTLDRLIPNMGYIPDNVRVISLRANRIKNDATLQELELVVRYLKNEQKLE